MKVFISADIEGTAVTATREGCRPGEFEYERSRKEMTAEVVAAAEGARAAGAELVVVKDAHGPGLNILPEELPEFALESCAGAADGPCWCCVAPCCCPFPGCIPPDWLEPVCAVAVETLVEPE